MDWIDRQRDSRIMSMTSATSFLHFEGFRIVIAGGALRDILLDRPVKDIDIYIANHHFGGLRDSGLFGRWQNTGERQYQESLIIQTWECVAIHRRLKECFEGISEEINVIVIDSPSGVNIAKILDSFDLGICRVATSVGTGLVYTRDFENDANNKCMTILNDSNKQFVLAHYMRIAEKYPDWPLVMGDN